MMQQSTRGACGPQAATTPAPPLPALGVQRHGARHQKHRHPRPGPGESVSFGHFTIRMLHVMVVHTRNTDIRAQGPQQHRANLARSGHSLNRAPSNSGWGESEAILGESFHSYHCCTTLLEDLNNCQEPSTTALFGHVTIWSRYNLVASPFGSFLYHHMCCTYRSMTVIHIKLRQDPSLVS